MFVLNTEKKGNVEEKTKRKKKPHHYRNLISLKSVLNYSSFSTPPVLMGWLVPGNRGVNSGQIVVSLRVSVWVGVCVCERARALFFSAVLVVHH